METSSPNLKRVKRKIKGCQNPLFEKWLKEWKEEAKNKGSESQHCFNMALKSLRKYPFKINTGKECIMLENFGSKICQMLDKKLEEHHVLYQNGPNQLNGEPNRNLNINEPKNSKKKKINVHCAEISKVKESEYDAFSREIRELMPTAGSEAWSLLIFMYRKSLEKNFKGFLTKTEIQELCPTLHAVSKQNSYYSFCSEITVLTEKELVEKHENLDGFRLTPEGITMASTLVSNLKASESLVTTKDNREQKKKSLLTNKKDLPPKPEPKKKVYSQIIESNNISYLNQADSLKDQVLQDNIFNETIIMLPNTFRIILLVDTQERDNKYQQSEQMTMRYLKSRNVDFDIRHLKVGDFIWIARNNEGQELVLPYIIERKRVDDLASSIKDGRFHEQKFRLKQSGIENLIYLVEKYGTENQRLGLPLPTLMQAISNTQIVGNFTVHITFSHNHSMRYLDIMTTQLNNIFKNKTLVYCKKSDLPSFNLSDNQLSLMSFQDFNKGSEKNKKATVRNMLIKHLMQLKGLSVEKSKAIVHLYPTPKLLMEALKKPDGEKHISKISFGNFNRSLGMITAKQIKMLYTSPVLN